MKEHPMPEANIFIERRENPRFTVKVPIQYRLVKGQEEIDEVADWRVRNQTAKMMDLSLGGMQIVLDQNIVTGSVMCFDVVLPNSANLSSVFAEVVWVDESRIGLHFIMIKNEDLEALRSFLDEESCKQNES
jgi:c-di-GMP-binding flagellar brake protein YcgR